jgi:hypothetical protein
MHGFPLTIDWFGIRKRMCGKKRGFPTEEAAIYFDRNPLLKNVYCCPFCCMFHRTHHRPKPRYEREKWLVIWHLEAYGNNLGIGQQKP